ncbi:MAG TPA: XdhC/CoxI family protein [Pyrinomonadaceae bacterium]|nr:XdhC/CoxI family protein [Pyrinomonadaceae bacterium]
MTPDKARAEANLGDHIRQLLAGGKMATLVTVLDSSALDAGAKLLIHAGGQTFGDLGDPRLNDAAVKGAAGFLSGRDVTKALKVSEITAELESLADTWLLFERIETEPRLVIAGAGHVGASLARLAALVGYDVSLIDDRSEFVVRELFSSPAEQAIRLLTARSWSDAMREAIGNGRGVSVAIVTRGHKQDEDCLRATIAAQPEYIGMIGSKRRTNIVLDKLREEGFDPERLTRVRAPIGLDIGAVSPEEVALAILAEIIAERRGGPGTPLSRWRRDHAK